MRESIWISWARTYTYKVLTFVKWFFSILLKGEVTECFDLAAFILTWQIQHVRYINLISLEHVAHEYDTSVEDTDRKWWIFLPARGSLSVPSVARSLALPLSSTPEQVQLRRQLCILPCITGIIRISFWPLPLVCHPWSARVYQVVYLALTDGHTLKVFYLTHSRIDSCHFIH